MIDRDDFSPKHAHADKQRAMHFAIVSTEIPPAASGQARVLGHLLVADNVKWTLLTEHVPEGGCWPGSSVQALSPPRFRVPRGFYRSGLANGVDGALVFDICRRAAEITYMLQQERPSLLIGCSGSPFDLPAANLAARQLGIPFVAYLFDDPVFQWPPGKFRELAAWQEQIWSHHVTALITPNEFLSAEIRRRTTLEAHVIRNPRSYFVASSYATAMERRRYENRLHRLGVPCAGRRVPKSNLCHSSNAELRASYLHEPTSICAGRVRDLRSSGHSARTCQL